jgi:NhaP-type Na+/H+ or K+/H+ antiporter
MSTTFFNVGAVCFGVVIGWITYRTLRHVDKTSISDLASVVGAVGGATVLAIFKRGDSFGWYAIGLAAGFFAYLALNLIFDFGGTTKWMGGEDSPSGRGGDVLH